MEKQQIKKGFSLVELIIVITILAILVTISFISYNNYILSSKKTIVVNDVKTISKNLEIFNISKGNYPIPDNNISISLSGNKISYQGIIGNNNSQILGINKIPLNPLNSQNYNYSVNSNKNGYSIIGVSNLDNIIEASEGNISFLTYSGGNLLTSNIDLYGFESGNIYTQYLNIDNFTNGYGYEIAGGLENYNKNNGSLSQPKYCPDGFIPVKGNIEFSQPGFCIMKYEASYDGVSIPNSSGGSLNWNSVNYLSYSGNIAVSKPGNYPIADISQYNAIKECQKIGGHLTTNNEWMTIARQIENNPKNWNSGIVGSGYIYNGLSNSIYGCKSYGNGIYNDLIKILGAKTGPGGVESCDNKRKLYLENQEIIWDFAGNLTEQVNKNNSIYGLNFDKGKTIVEGTSTGTNWDDDGLTSEYKNIKYLSKNGYGLSHGFGSIGYGSGVSNNVFWRGGDNYSNDLNGIYNIFLKYQYFTIYAGTGFRCAY